MEIDNIYNEDCIETMKRMPDNFIDLTVTSPPYDNLRTYNGYCFDFENVAKQLYRVTKEGGVVVWVVGDATVDGSETLTSFKQALYFKEVGFNVHDTMIYYSDKPPLTHNRYEQKFEYMFVLSKGKPKTFNPIMIDSIQEGRDKGLGGFREPDNHLRQRNTPHPVNEKKIKGNVWIYATGFGGSTNDKFAFEHPAMFPEKLAADHIRSWSNEGRFGVRLLHGQRHDSKDGYDAQPPLHRLGDFRRVLQDYRQTAASATDAVQTILTTEKRNT